MKAGKIIRGMGPVVDVRFADEKVPKIKEALYSFPLTFFE